MSMTIITIDVMNQYLFLGQDSSAYIDSCGKDLKYFHGETEKKNTQ